VVSIIDSLGDLLIEHGERIVIDQTMMAVARAPIDRLVNQQSTSDLFEERRGILFGETRLMLGLAWTGTCRVSDRFQSEIVRRYQRERVAQTRTETTHTSSDQYASRATRKSFYAIASYLQCVRRWHE
jgi:hypothetical protein